MAWSTVWGGYVGSSYPRLRAGAKITVQDTAPSNHVHIELWAGVSGSIAYNGVSFSWKAWTSEGQFQSGSGTFNANTSNSEWAFSWADFNVPISWRTPLDWAFSVSVTNPLTGGTSTATIDNGWIPFGRPAAPIPSTATILTSPDRASLAWQGNQHQSYRIQNLAIDRQRGTGSWQRWSNLNGDSTAVTDNTLTKGYGYRYRIRAENSWPQQESDWVTTGWVDTTPLDVSNIVAAKTSGGDIAVTWTNPSTWWNGQTGKTEIYDVGSGSPVLLATLDGNYSSWTHLSPSTSQAHRYNVRHATYNAPVLRSSDQVFSNTVTLITPPLAPSGVGPAIMDPLDSPRPSVVWTHNPVDTTGQTAYQLQHRLAGSGTWTTLAKTVSAVSAYQTTGVYSRGQSMEVQVRTWGAATTGGSDGTGASPWSATQVVVMDGRPAATILTPADGVSEVDTLTVTAGCTTADNVTVTLDGVAETVALATSDNTATLVATKIRAATFPGWSTGGTGAVVTFTAGSIGTRTAPAYSAGSTGAAGSIVRTVTGMGIPPVGGASLTAQHAYSDPESTAQSAAEWRLLDATGTTVLEVIPINGSDTSVTFTTVLANSTTYQVDVRVRDGAGQWSVRTARTFAVAYLPPAIPAVATQWDETTGACQLTLGYTAPAEAGTTVRLTITGPVTATGDITVTLPGGGTDWYTIQPAEVTTPTEVAGLISQFTGGTITSSGWTTTQDGATVVFHHAGQITGDATVTYGTSGVTGTTTVTRSDVATVVCDLVEIRRDTITVTVVDAPLPGQPITVIDPIPPTDADPLQLEVVAWATSGSQASALVDVPVPWMVHRTVYLNAGPGWSIVAAAMYDLKVSEDSERSVQATVFAGRTSPVLTYGPAVKETIKIGGRLPPEADRLVFRRVQEAGTVVCLRWPEGRRWVMLSGPSLSTGATSPTHDLSLSATVVDHQEV